MTVAATVGFSSLLASIDANQVAATSISELENQKNELQKERSGLNTNINEAEQRINELQAEQEKIHKEIKRLDMTITDTNNKIREKNAEITDKQQEIDMLKEEISELLLRIEKRNEVLKGRALSFQENGGVISYLDVLLGAQNFSDFIDRVSSVATIMEADKSILNQHNDDKQLLEEKQTMVEDELASLEKMRSDLQVMEGNLKTQKSEKDSLVTSLKTEEKEVAEAKFSLEEEERILAAQQAAVQATIQSEKKRQAEEAKRKAEEAKRQQQNSSNGNSGNNSGPSVSAPPVSNGTFTNPAVGRFTSGFGPRSGSFHYGIDIANRAANVPVVSAADGVVFLSYYSPSYGNVIFIRHSINGQIFTTVYAHLDSRHVGAGTTVSKGQFIGYMGNTGYSKGKHLHFEVHRGDWNASKSNAVNPLNYVNY